MARRCVFAFMGVGIASGGCPGENTSSRARGSLPRAIGVTMKLIWLPGLISRRCSAGVTCAPAMTGRTTTTGPFPNSSVSAFLPSAGTVTLRG